MDHVQSFIRQLTDILKIVDSTVAARQKFAEFKEEFPSLTIVPIQKWAGVGAVWLVFKFFFYFTKNLNFVQPRKISFLFVFK